MTTATLIQQWRALPKKQREAVYLEIRKDIKRLDDSGDPDVLTDAERAELFRLSDQLDADIASGDDKKHKNLDKVFAKYGL